MQEEISFGVWLRKQRRALDLSRQAFADQVGCAEVTLRRIEAGTLKPSKELASVLLEHLGIPKAERPQWISFARGLSGFPSQSPPSANRQITNLPAPLTSFIGREKQQLEIIQLITKHRLVTLTGSGGVGKTRLATRIGEQVLGNYLDGVWLVELAPILDPFLVSRTTAIAIGLSDEPQRPVIDMLSDYLQKKQLLIILDNCEHLLDACAELADTLLKRCPGLKILATSRESLGMLGEAMYRVPSLEIPDIQELLEKLRQYESIRLFEERAQLTQTDFSLTIENASSVAKICRQLDGIPLAIELAAARVNMFSTDQIAERLQESFDLLTTGNRTALSRHQTLQAAIDWSYDLLSRAEQTLFRRLSVFVNGWTLEAAESICSDANIQSETILDLLVQLTNKSLVITNETQSGTRYHMLETIRQYAREKLIESSKEENIRTRHLVYFTKLAEQAEPELYSSNQIFWGNKLWDEIDNLRSAMEWTLANDIKSGFQLITNLGAIWDIRGDSREGEYWLKLLLEHYYESDSLHARALANFGAILGLTGKPIQAQFVINQGLELSRAISDKSTEALCLWQLGNTIGYQGDVGQSTPILEKSLALYRSLGDKRGQANVMSSLSINNNDIERSKSFLFESLRLYRELAHLAGIAECSAKLAHYAIWEGDFSSAIRWLEDARTLHHELGNQSGEAGVLENFGILAYWQGNYQQACAYFEASIILNEKISNSWPYWPRVHMAYAILRQGNIAQAKEMFETSIRHIQKADYLGCLVYALEGLASLFLIQEQPNRAACVIGWADATRAVIGDTRPKLEQADVDKIIWRCIAKMGEAAFSDVYENGTKMSLDEAISLALKES